MPERDINTIFIENLKRLLKDNNMTYKELAYKLNIRASTVSMWMSGVNTPRMDILDNIADLFNISTSALLTDTSINQEPNKYYLNDDARDLAQFMFENPEYKVLFDASRKVKKDDIEFVKQMIDRMKGDSDNSGC